LKVRDKEKKIAEEEDTSLSILCQKVQDTNSAKQKDTKNCCVKKVVKVF
jgi:hypothetical protein